MEHSNARFLPSGKGRAFSLSLEITLLSEYKIEVLGIGR